MSLEIHIYHHIVNEVPDGGKLDQILEGIAELRAGHQRLEDNVSKLSDAIAALDASVDSAVVRVETDLAALKAEIARLQALIDEGLATQEDLDALAEVKGKIDALDQAAVVAAQAKGKGRKKK